MAHVARQPFKAAVQAQQNGQGMCKFRATSDEPHTILATSNAGDLDDLADFIHRDRYHLSTASKSSAQNRDAAR
jgi:hypothetical protein